MIFVSSRSGEGRALAPSRYFIVATDPIGNGLPTLLAPPLDLFNPAQSARDAAAAIPGARFVEIPSVQGHQAAISTKAEDAAVLNRVIGAFLKR